MECISKRACEITPFLVMDVLEAAQQMEREGKNIIHMEIGEPDFDTPECIKKACCKALDKGETHYTHSLGIPELRQAISKYHKNRYNVDVDPGRIIVTQGTSPAMLLLFTFILDQGDNVITSDPCYACYDNFIKFAGAESVKVTISEEDGFQFRPEAIAKAINDKTKAILINSPSNPTGTVLSPERMKKIANLGPWIISDEIYHGLVYGEQEHSILEYTDHAFVLNGFSKLFAMTGWRLGYIIAPEKYIRPMQKLCQNFFISANSMAQWAGVAALTESWDDVNRIKDIYDERRKFMIKRLREIGFDIKVEPTAAFYILVNMKTFAEKFGGSSYKLAFDILEKAHIGVTPGVDFGQGAEGYIRFSYANSIENLAEGMNRLEKYVKEFK